MGNSIKLEKVILEGNFSWVTSSQLSQIHSNFLTMIYNYNKTQNFGNKTLQYTILKHSLIFTNKFFIGFLVKKYPK
jgi:hypothetical protein